jgi:hypothetical protein
MLGVGRERYDDIDDFCAVSATPPRDSYNVLLGTENGAGGQRHPNFAASTGLYANWRQAVEVYYVNNTNLSQRLAAGQTSNYRAVEVKILDDTRELARLRRVIAYVPEP